MVCVNSVVMYVIFVYYTIDGVWFVVCTLLGLLILVVDECFAVLLCVNGSCVAVVSLVLVADWVVQL